jgi:hypothetical protein
VLAINTLNAELRLGFKPEPTLESFRPKPQCAASVRRPLRPNRLGRRGSRLRRAPVRPCVAARR